jgi:hypothetical protein
MDHVTLAQVRKWTGISRAAMTHQCHAVSLAIVRSGQLGKGARVARGTCLGLASQHSWVTVGDPYDPGSPIVDATLWSYRPDVQGCWNGTLADLLHVPHGAGTPAEEDFPRSVSGGVTGEVLLKPSRPLSRAAHEFLAGIGPLDIQGWFRMAHLPVQGWPSAEIIRAMYDTPVLRAFVPIDIVGMVTDVNPGGLYF